MNRTRCTSKRNVGNPSFSLLQVYRPRTSIQEHPFGQLMLTIAGLRGVLELDNEPYTSAQENVHAPFVIERRVAADTAKAVYVPLGDTPGY